MNDTALSPFALILALAVAGGAAVGIWLGIHPELIPLDLAPSVVRPALIVVGAGIAMDIVARLLGLHLLRALLFVALVTVVSAVFAATMAVILLSWWPFPSEF